MRRVSAQDWRPRGVEDLEPEGWRALRQPGCVCVVAGPGAGKTEFLAQRAVYLLETAICPPPGRVLAISFKTDAADNLAKRVRQRCPADLAGRFVSLTFDAFTKGIVDRFLNAIPLHWRPTHPYSIEVPTRGQVEHFLEVTRMSAPADWRPSIAELSSVDFESRIVGASRLPLVRTEPRTARAFAVASYWRERLERRGPSSLTFVGLNRLAELLLRANPQLRRALRATYPFVFVDEFQDTTYGQYDFLISAFADGRTAVTAVGDNKQRIMAWAGARLDAFEKFETDFAATRIALQFNFRSSADLVRIQHVVARALDPTTAPTIAQAQRRADGDVAQVWNSATKQAEAEYLARWLSDDMGRRGQSPRDYALLVRQKADTFEADLNDALNAAGLRLRNESHVLGRTTLQDLLVDDLARIAVAILRLGAARRAPNEWGIASTAVRELRNVEVHDDLGQHRADGELTEFLTALRDLMSDLPLTRDSAAALADRVLGFLDLAAVRRTYIEYGTGDLLTIMAEAFALHLANCVEGAADWAGCLDAFEGVAQIPLMTVHKSKGLEYDTIVFVGLDDQAWWSYARGNPEGLATFFVALSRAKQRAIFLFCQERGRRERIADLFRLLTDAGVPEVAV